MHGAYYDGILRIVCAGSPEVVLAAGEIDQARYLGLVSTPEDLVDPEGDVHVNLGGLVYCDLAGLRILGWDSTPVLIVNEPAQLAAGPSGIIPAGLVAGSAAIALRGIGQRSRIQLTRPGKVP